MQVRPSRMACPKCCTKIKINLLSIWKIFRFVLELKKSLKFLREKLESPILVKKLPKLDRKSVFQSGISNFRPNYQIFDTKNQKYNFHLIMKFSDFGPIMKFPAQKIKINNFHVIIRPKNQYSIFTQLLNFRKSIMSFSSQLWNFRQEK